MLVTVGDQQTPGGAILGRTASRGRTRSHDGDGSVSLWSADKTNERRRRTAGVRYSKKTQVERRSSGGYAPRPPWLALRARYLIRSAKLNLTESDYARSAKFFLGALRYEFRKHFKATNDKIVPPTRPVWTPRRRESTDDERRIFFFLF